MLSSQLHASWEMETSRPPCQNGMEDLERPCLRTSIHPPRVRPLSHVNISFPLTDFSTVQLWIDSSRASFCDFP